MDCGASTEMGKPPRKPPLRAAHPQRCTSLRLVHKVLWYWPPLDARMARQGGEGSHPTKGDPQSRTDLAPSSLFRARSKCWWTPEAQGRGWGLKEGEEAGISEVTPAEGRR